MKKSRRDFLKNTTLASIGLILSNPLSIIANTPNTQPIQQNTFPFKLPELPYSYDALEPFIDKQTMEIHHTKHHQAYVNNLNKAIENYATAKSVTLEEILKNISQYDVAVKNNAGGHYNHTLFWKMMAPNKDNTANMPSEKILKEINKTFGSFENFTKQFSEAALKLFGSGWCWLIKAESGKLHIITSANQENPIMGTFEKKGIPILALDVWEHAYYLKYQNKRTEYIQNWWKVVNWNFVEQLYFS